MVVCANHAVFSVAPHFIPAVPIAYPNELSIALPMSLLLRYLFLEGKQLIIFKQILSNYRLKKIEILIIILK